ncbi:hypothetical protein GCM10007940_41930 [Portibacter lacus]|uniref:Uncharacterized protein n=1 Tax=Portibacter lacus TaxID=1099794 RepID=A0AA37ST43_9BACT|nr:hypothetical protein GCM10007940_41930 [Portibacter lacus]
MAINEFEILNQNLNGNITLFGKLDPALQVFTSLNETKYLYIGTISNTSVKWMGKNTIPLIIPKFQQGIVYLDFKDPII